MSDDTTLKDKNTQHKINAIQSELIDTQRHKNWINASIGFKSISDFIAITIQNIGTLDSRLVNEDQELISTGAPKNPFNALNDHITNSYLWVLGLYEIVRTISQYSDNNKESPLNKYCNEIKILKNKINRLRVPLAKFEASFDNSEDSPIAYPGNSQFGIAWQIDKNTWISRRELSDNTLELFTEISNKTK